MNRAGFLVVERDRLADSELQVPVRRREPRLIFIDLDKAMFVETRPLLID